MNTLLHRFLRYVALDTQSDPDSPTSPSTSGQTEFLRTLREELTALGVNDADLDAKGVLYARLPGGVEGPVLGLIAHVDTSPAVSGKNVTPRVHGGWDGTPLELAPDVVLNPEDCPGLLRYRGGTLITSDGTTLLGADDKAGVAIIMETCRILMENPGRPRPALAVAFTTDEEIGRGMDAFDPQRFGADFAYTVDGCGPGSVDSATFNACRARWRIAGVEVHPGSAYRRMVNPVRIAADLVSMLKTEEMPENSRDEEGYDYPAEIRGGPREAQVSLLLRDFTDEGMRVRMDRQRLIQTFLRGKYPGATVELDLEEQYRNPLETLARDRRLVEFALKGSERAGVPARETRIRGGTDGSRLSFMGVPTVNLPTGGDLFHSRREWVALEGMQESLNLLLYTLEEWAGASSPGGCSPC